MKTIPAIVVYRNGAEGTPQLRATVPATTSIELIAGSAARLLFRPVKDCSFLLERFESGTHLQAITPDAVAIVGPFPGPRTLPTSLPSNYGVPLSELLAHLNLTQGPHDYVAEIRYRENVRKPRRRRGVSESDYAAAMAAYEAAKIDESKRVALRSIYFPVPPESWDVEDLETFVGRLLAVLPPFERFWHAHIEPKGGRLRHGRRSKYDTRFQLTVATSDFTATLWLPAFPADALTEWIESQHFCVSLSLSEDSVRRAAAAGAVEQHDAA